MQVDSDGFEDDAIDKGFQFMNTGVGNETNFRIEVNSIPITLSQDPHNTAIGHGAVVWEASVIFAKYLEHSSDKGLSPANLKGKRVIELGCGPGLGGLALMLAGCEVVFTDLNCVIDELTNKNVERVYRNLMSQGANGLDLVKPKLHPLDWTDKSGIATIKCVAKCYEGFDIVLLCDCVFSELLVPDLVRSISEACGPRAVVYCVHEIRDESANEAFLKELSKSFTLKTVPKAKQHPDYTHPLVQLVVAKPRRR